MKWKSRFSRSIQAVLSVLSTLFLKKWSSRSSRSGRAVPLALVALLLAFGFVWSSSAQASGGTVARQASAARTAQLKVLGDDPTPTPTPPPCDPTIPNDPNCNWPNGGSGGGGFTGEAIDPSAGQLGLLSDDPTPTPTPPPCDPTIPNDPNCNWPNGGSGGGGFTGERAAINAAHAISTSVGQRLSSSAGSLPNVPTIEQIVVHIPRYLGASIPQ